jgi:hydroxymethylpyrimidine/phosphomethylpyrimidine kinase
MISKHGLPLMTEDARSLLALQLLPRAFLVTPNLHEAEELAKMPVRDLESMERAAAAIAAMGAKAVLIKGGHLQGDAVDLLYRDGNVRLFSSPRTDTRNTHGTGCTYSACITAEIAKGKVLEEAVDIAKKYISKAIETNPGLGRGAGPVNHHARVDVH